MGFLNKLFGGNKNQASPSTEHAVIVHFDYGFEGMEKIYNLSDKLEKVLEKNNLGDYDGHEIALDYSDGFLYMYGPNAETLFKGIKSTLEETDFLKGAKVKLRFGPPEDGVKEITFEIKQNNYSQQSGI